MPMLTTFGCACRCALPLAAADASAKAAILSSTSCTSGTTSFAVDEMDSDFGRAQGDVQDGAVLGDVDLVAAEHGVDALAQAGLFGELR
jgi:hypothetical protein